MPAVNAADLAALRDQFQWSKFYLGVLKPATVHTSQINYPAMPRGTLAIPFDGGVYAAGFTVADIRAGMTLWVGTTAGTHDICKLRIRTPYNRTCAAGSAYTTADGGVTGTITVCEHNYLLLDNYYLTIKEEFRLWPKHAIAVQGGIDVLRYNDYDVQYCGQNKDANRQPIVRMGPPAVAIRDALGIATINFWSDSGIAPGGAAIVSYAWTWRGGTWQSGPGAGAAGTAANPNVVTWTVPGFYLATLTITTATGTAVGYRPVFIYDSTFQKPYEAFEVQSLSGDFDTGGWRMTVRVKQECAEADFPEESMIIIWAEDWYKGSQVSIGGNYRYRENNIFVGFITKETVRKDSFTDDVLFEAHTIDGEMKNCEQFPLSVEDDPNANSNWLQIQNMTMDKVAYFIAKWQSTLLDITDVHFSGDTKLVRFFDMAQKSLYEQLDKDCYDSAILGRCLSDRMGIVRNEINPQFLDVGADRNALATVMDIQTQDWRNEIELPKPQTSRCSLVDLSAGYYAGALADVALIFSLAHGDIMMERGRTVQLDNLIGASQNQCNRVAGNYLANQNNPYPDVRVPIGLNYRVFDITPQEWVTMTIDPTAVDPTEALDAFTFRGIKWTAERLIPRSVSFNLENVIGALNVDLGLEMETSGTAGVPGNYPTTPPEEPYEPPPTPVVPPWSPAIDDWEGIWVVGCWGAGASVPGVLRTEDLGGCNASVPVWTAWTTGLDLVNFPYCRFIDRDPWNPQTRIYCLMAADAPGVQNDCGQALYRRVYSGGAWGSWTAILNETIINSTIGWNIKSGTGWISRFTGNINASGHLYCMVTVERGADGWMPQYFFKSTNFGTAWVATEMDVQPDNSPQVIPICVRAGMLLGTSEHAAGQVLYASWRNRSAFHYPAFSVSTDQGATWAFVDGGTNVNRKGQRMMVDPNNQNIIYVLGDETGGGHNQDSAMAVFKYTSHGAAYTQLAAYGNVTRAVVCAAGNANSQIAASTTVLKKSTNGGTAVTSIPVTGNIAGGGLFLNWNLTYLMSNHSYINGVNGTRYFQISGDGGVTWYNKHGNMAGNFNGLVTTGFSLDN